MSKPVKKKSFKARGAAEELKSVKEDLLDLQIYLGEFSAFLPLPIMSVNPLGFVLDANKAFEDLTGFGKMKILGGPLERFFLEKEELAEFQEKALQGKSVQGKELTLIAKRKKVPVSLYLASRKDNEGNVIGYFMGMYDITEFKKFQQTLEEKVRERTRELQDKVEELEKFRKLSVGREIKMIELKREINELKGRET